MPCTLRPLKALGTWLKLLLPEAALLKANRTLAWAGVVSESVQFGIKVQVKNVAAIQRGLNQCGGLAVHVDGGMVPALPTLPALSV